MSAQDADLVRLRKVVAEEYAKDSTSGDNSYDQGWEDALRWVIDRIHEALSVPEAGADEPCQSCVEGHACDEHGALTDGGEVPKDRVVGLMEQLEASIAEAKRLFAEKRHNDGPDVPNGVL